MLTKWVQVETLLKEAVLSLWSLSRSRLDYMRRKMDNWPVRGNLEEWLVCPREEVAEKGSSFHLPRIFQVCEHFCTSQPLSSYSSLTICSEWIWANHRDSVFLLISYIISHFKRKKLHPSYINNLGSKTSKWQSWVEIPDAGGSDRTFRRHKAAGSVLYFRLIYPAPWALPFSSTPSHILSPPPRSQSRAPQMQTMSVSTHPHISGGAWE